LVHLVVGHPEGDLRNLDWELFNLDAVKLIDINEDDGADGELTFQRVFEYFAQDIEFEQAQLAVGDDEEVATTAGWVEDADGSELRVEFTEAFGVAADALELDVERIEEEGLQRFENVGSLV